MQITWLFLILSAYCIGCTRLTNPKVNIKFDPLQCYPEGLEATDTHRPNARLLIYSINDIAPRIRYSLSSNSSHLHVVVSDLQSLMQTVLADPRLTFTLTTKDLPPSTPFKLHTEDPLWLSAAPGLSHYPGMNISASIRFNPHDSVAVVLAIFSTSFRLVSAPPIPDSFAFETQITFAVSLDAQIEDDRSIAINGIHSTWDRPNIVVTSSTLGTVGTLELDYALSTLLSSLDSHVKVALLTFSEDLILSSSSIELQDDSILIVGVKKTRTRK